ncbi:hypothetical protein [Roseateles sp. BYS96W]|uniref:Uncharacterized protein n=1 Tax=Pelomonas nitida TaxID=3299027 RepID=A0ABW7G9U5_9BURK
MHFPSSRHPGRVRLACVENAGAPRDLAVIPFTLDATRPANHADALYEAFQFAWQCVPEALTESSLLAIAIDVAGPADSWVPVLNKAPLSTAQFVHYALRYQQRLAERCAAQVPRVPLPESWARPADRVLATLAVVLRGQRELHDQVVPALASLEAVELIGGAA